jgi:uncharacterized protein
MLLVIDTNVFVSALSSRSKFHWIIEDLMNEVFEIAVSTDILLEYEEVLKQKFNPVTAETFLQAIQELPNVHFITKYYQWQLLKDVDDDKFVDIAIAANAHYIVSEDNDFNVLKKVDFPVVIVLKINEFYHVLGDSKKG